MTAKVFFTSFVSRSGRGLMTMKQAWRPAVSEQLLTSPPLPDFPCLHFPSLPGLPAPYFTLFTPLFKSLYSASLLLQHLFLFHHPLIPNLPYLSLTPSPFLSSSSSPGRQTDHSDSAALSRSIDSANRRRTRLVGDMGTSDISGHRIQVSKQ